MAVMSTLLPSEEEATLAKLSSRELAAYVETAAASQQVAISDKEGRLHQVEVPVSALRLLVDILIELGDGNTVKLIPVHAEMTTQEAADMLGMSRPTLIKILDEGHIPYHRSGNRRKVKYKDVMHYKQAIDNKRLQALNELSELDQALGLGCRVPHN
ncbi:helix-turn-helix domain-containing protein [Halomonas meridiana]|uniref:helix-turn-helix domain-containing protein n=1 Tax=Vreelandella aquamarina TaxID=77097 RepID=UPI001E47D5FB|nr:MULTISPECIES: helix-turn-helix domain-containing protein [Halomonas]MCD1653026.1 helix-turn-helix domain-containing protein [Halomonas axialensis]MCD2089398.1 helix-turn-helix domain-containing protein [Halomonas meridiana]